LLSVSLFCCLVLLGQLVLSGIGSQAHAAAPLAGSLITNRATVQYFDVENGYPVTVETNEVRVTVQPQEALTLTSDNIVSLPPGAQVYLPHRLTNTGNTTSDYRIDIANLGGDNYDLENLIVVRDLNGNGLADANEPVVGPGDLIKLTPGQAIDLVISGTIPVGTPLGVQAQVSITATSAVQGAQAVNTDTITTYGGVGLRLNKSANTERSRAGEVLRFSLTALSVGASAPAPIATVVDGAARDLVIIRDVIPANTTFVDWVQSPPFGIRLYHIIGQSDETYVTSPPADLGQVDAIALGVENWQPVDLQVRLDFQVRVQEGTTATQIINTGEIRYVDPIAPGTPVKQPSNPVYVALERSAPTIRYYTDDSYTVPATSTGLGQPLYLQVNAASCNQDPTRAEIIRITVISLLTGDAEIIEAVETGPNTGFFRPVTPLPTRNVAEYPAQSGNEIMETTQRDTLRASIEDCSGQSAFTEILVNPFGVVFDARTNALIPGARVTLLDSNGNPVGPSYITGPDGRFEFPNAPAGNYSLLVEPPASWSFPSVVPPSLIPLDRRVDVNSSYGKPFTLLVNGGIAFDVPLDSGPPSGLFLEKEASDSIIERGDFLEYQLRLRNNTGVTMSNTVIEDVLPRGFTLVPGSVRRIDASGEHKMVDPIGAPGPRLAFELGAVVVNAEVTLVYRVRVSATAVVGDAVNRAQAHGASAYGVTYSNIAAAKVLLRSGVLTTRGIVVGKIFVDANKNRVQDVGEQGIPGVRVWLENGTYAITDSEGKYSIYGLSARTHVVKVDMTTLPVNAELYPLDFSHAGSGSSRFINLRMGGLVKANFAIQDATPEVLKEVETRRTNAAKWGTSLDAAFNTALQPTTQSQPYADNRGQEASGVVTTVAPAGRNAMTLDSVPTTGIASPAIPAGRLFERPALSGGTLGGNFGGSVLGSTDLKNESLLAPGSGGLVLGRGTLSNQGVLGAPDEQIPGGAFKVPSQEPIGAGNSNLPSTPVRTVPVAPLESLLDGLNNELGFIDLKDGDVLPIAQANVRIKGAAGSRIVLRANGSEISQKRVGTQSVIAERGLEVRDYIGVALEPGNNTLELQQLDVGGNVRGTVKINVIAPGKLGQLQVSTARGTIYADGRTIVPVRVRLVDDKGVPVTARTPLTLESNIGSWQIVDLNPLEPGVQVFIEGGYGEFPLLPPMQPGDGMVRVTSGILGASLHIPFVADLRPLVGVGVLEGRLGNFRVKGGKSTNTSSIFDEELRSLARSGDTNVDGRAAFFFKGRVLGKNLLTMRYDSQRDEEDERLFRDIQPDEFYPVYGDSSIRGFDAQSTSRLYVRIDRERSYMLYGDYTTPTQNLARALGEYNRSLTGLKLHHESKRFTLNMYGARTSTQQIVDEIPANGTSGPYRLRGGDVRFQSEKVEIIIRDRNQPSVILRVEPQTRFSDYQIDGLTEGILFRAPVPSRDANLNPIYIRVTYEMETGGPSHSVGGFDLQYMLTKKLAIGGSYAQDRDPADPFKLRSVNAMYRFRPSTLLILEAATTERESEGKGNAGRVELLHEGSRLQARLLLARSDKQFSNQSSLLSSGREEFSLRTTYRLNSNRRLIAEAIRTRDLETEGTRQGALVSVEQNLSRGTSLEIGLRHARETGESLSGEDVDFTSLRARLTGKLPRRPVTLFTEYERAISGEGQAFTVGGEYQFDNRSRLYFMHDLVNSLQGRYALNDGQRQNSTVVGIDTDYMKNGRAFSEYRIRDDIDGRGAEAAIGLRNLWSIGKGLRLGTSFERVKSLGGSSSNSGSGSGTYLDDGTAASVALEYLPREDLKATARFETRFGDNEDSYLGTLGIAYRASRDWTFLARSLFLHRNRKDEGGSSDIDGGRSQMRLQLGAAWRQTERDKWNGLAKYEYRTDDEHESFDSRFRRKSHILSLDLNNQLNADTEIGVHYAMKKSIADGSGLQSSGMSHLLSGRFTRGFKRRYEASLLAGALWDSRGGKGIQTGLAAEISYRITRDMTLGIGYSLLDVRDEDLGMDFNKRGAYVRWRWKFDEDLFGRRRPAKETK